MKLVEKAVKGNRHKSLWDYGMKLRGINLPAADIVKDMEAYNREACDPPISKYDIDRLIISVLKWEFTK